MHMDPHRQEFLCDIFDNAVIIDTWQYLHIYSDYANNSEYDDDDSWIEYYWAKLID